jgi:hypothetical protein
MVNGRAGLLLQRGDAGQRAHDLRKVFNVRTRRAAFTDDSVGRTRINPALCR